MKQSSEIADEIISHSNSLDDIHPGIADGLKDAITSAIHARDDAHAAEVERLKADVKRISDVRDELMDNLTYWRDSHRGLQAELESARAVIGKSREAIRQIVELGNINKETTRILIAVGNDLNNYAHNEGQIPV